MNITHILYECSCDISFIKSLIESGRTGTAIEELNKLEKQIENDYITSRGPIRAAYYLYVNKLAGRIFNLMFT